MAERQDNKTTTGSQGYASAGAAGGGTASASRPQGGGANPSMRGASDLAGAAVETARDMAGEAVENARGMAGQLVEDVREVAESLLEEQKERAVEQVAGVAHALRKTAEELRQENELIGRYAEQAADQVERLAETVRQRGLGDLVADLDDFARRQPTMFLVGAVAAGFIVGRFMAASAERNRHEYGRDYGRTGGPRQDTGSRETRTRTAGYGASAGTRGNGHSRSATMGNA
jgi:hypothetical protein